MPRRPPPSDASTGDFLGSGPNRRQFLGAVAAGVPALALVPGTSEAATPPSAELDLVLRVNGTDHPLRVDPRTTLLDALRERLDLTGTKKGCDHGQCGACTVHVEGRRVLACLTLALSVQGRAVTTIEGVAQGDSLHPMQAAFIAEDGLQCGYCTPGQIMSAIALLGEPVGPTDDDVREHMSGNICRCGAYPNIVAAVQAARRKGA
jgi:xanthine dehydrogenase YagT iron-sulfur-binding subunit